MTTQFKNKADEWLGKYYGGGMYAQSVKDFASFLDRESESDPGPCYRCHRWPCKGKYGCKEGPLMTKPRESEESVCKRCKEKYPNHKYPCVPRESEEDRHGANGECKDCDYSVDVSRCPCPKHKSTPREESQKIEKLKEQQFQNGKNNSLWILADKINEILTLLEDRGRK